MDTKRSIKKTVTEDDPTTVCDFLATATGISKTKLKGAMHKGAAWLRRKGKKRARIRRATAPVNHGDTIELYYDAQLLALIPPQARCLMDRRHYSVWCKPAGLMTQGTMYGDHCSLLRQAELAFTPQRTVFPVHRLDREATGLVMVAHTKDAAAKLSALFSTGRITKHYRIEVLGTLASLDTKGTISLPLDGRAAVTEFETDRYDAARNTTTADVRIVTGRLHQIRRHFAMIGFPVMGDPRYGMGNRNTDGLKLAAVALDFTCPFSGEFTVIRL
jgi:tRNA pseudouridine32 synthase/23S rRNA pseudouridine746 synthase